MIKQEMRCETTQRISTGVLQIGKDWPGIFIRGDEALAMASVIELYLVEQGAPIVEHPVIKNLLDLLRSCDVNAKAA